MFADHLQEAMKNGGDIEKVTTRVGYRDGLIEAGERDENVVALCCD